MSGLPKHVPREFRARSGDAPERAAAAFSPADALPLTRRVKLLMMMESVVSLVMLVVVASRAIGLLSG